MDNLELDDLAIDELQELPSIDDLLAYIMADSSPATSSPIFSETNTLFTKKISIRVPHHVLTAFKDRAGEYGIGYQTLINHVLADFIFGVSPCRGDLKIEVS